MLNHLSCVGLGLLLGMGLAAFDLTRRQGPTASTAPSWPGAQARWPYQIPARGWRQILKRTWTDFNGDRIPAVAAGATFYSLLSLFPALGAFAALYGMFADVHDARKQVIALAGLLPGGAIQVLGDELTRLAEANHAGLSLTFIAGLVLSIWTANAGVKSVIAGLNVAYDEDERRGFLKLNLISLTFTLGATLFSVLAVAAMVSVPEVLSRVGLADIVGASVLRWPMLALATVTFASLLYRFGPDREHARWRWITPGGILGAFGWIAMSLLFTTYVAHFGHYNKTYGSLGAVVGFMTWIWLSLNVILLGAELNAEIERQTTVDTTTGPPLPRGSRGAAVAEQ